MSGEPPPHSTSMWLAPHRSASLASKLDRTFGVRILCEGEQREARPSHVPLWLVPAGRIGATAPAQPAEPVVVVIGEGLVGGTSTVPGSPLVLNRARRALAKRSDATLN